MAKLQGNYFCHQQPRIAIFIFCFVLLLSSEVKAIRLHPTDSTSVMQESMKHDKAFDEGLMEVCADGKDEEECLMRRGLGAHIDYIYTQDKP
eukprot:Gb_22897 [translate_table: standard]